MKHLATIEAYENKQGSFSTVINDGKSRLFVERFLTYEEARNAVKLKAWEIYGPVKYAPVKMKGRAYKANIWQ